MNNEPAILKRTMLVQLRFRSLFKRLLQFEDELCDYFNLDRETMTKLLYDYAMVTVRADVSPNLKQYLPKNSVDDEHLKSLIFAFLKAGEEVSNEFWMLADLINREDSQFLAPAHQLPPSKDDDPNL